MTVFKRAAGLVALFSFVACASIATPGLAKDIDRSNLSSADLANIASNVPGFLPVPVIAGTPDTQTAVDEAVPSYASLDAAVAAMPDAAEVTDDLTCLAGAIYYESKGEPLAGQLAVADVILNRAHSGRFPTSVCSVVTQPGQFSFVRHGHIPPVAPDRAAYRTAVAVAQVALQKAWDSPAPQALYFHARHVAPHWDRAQVAAIGNHLFYR